eukprot:4014489-Pleurochrysis_carterae.AAC.1
MGWWLPLQLLQHSLASGVLTPVAHSSATSPLSAVRAPPANVCRLGGRWVGVETPTCAAAAVAIMRSYMSVDAPPCDGRTVTGYIVPLYICAITGR